MQLTTERLLLRRPTEADVSSPPAWLADPAVMDWLGGVEPAADVVRLWLRQWEVNPCGKFLVDLEGAVIGRVGCNFYDTATWSRDPGGVPELGWAIAREHWGKGYATEAARAVRDWLDAPRVVSLIAPDNARSQAVARRLGAVPGAAVDVDDGPFVVWEHPWAKMAER